MPAERKHFPAVFTGNKVWTELIWGDIKVCLVRHEQVTEAFCTDACFLVEKFLCSRLILGTGTRGLSEQPAEGPSQVLSYTGAEKVDF